MPYAKPWRLERWAALKSGDYESMAPKGLPASFLDYPVVPDCPIARIMHFMWNHEAD